jgi:hypothetical protein
MADDAPHFDGTFYNNYKAIWDSIPVVRYIPLPDDAMKALVGAFGNGWLGHGLLVNAFDVAPGIGTKFWWDSLPSLSFSTKSGLTAWKEARAVLSAAAWAGYTGLLIGVGIVAAYETWGGARVAHMLGPLAREVERLTGKTFDVALESMLLQANFNGAAFHRAMHVGRLVSNPRAASMPQRRPAGGW